VARPVGSFVLGHLGDTIGRKRVLVLTLFGMGAATFLIGVLPTYEQIGFAAPVLLLVLRICQGLAVSGEQSSASSTTLEHVPPHRRAFLTSFTLGGTQGGNILASAAFLPVAALPEDALLSWGWRIPFLLSAVVLLVCWWIRRSRGESPVFVEEQKSEVVPREPLKVLIGLRGEHHGDGTQHVPVAVDRGQRARARGHPGGRAAGRPIRPRPTSRVQEGGRHGRRGPRPDHGRGEARRLHDPACRDRARCRRRPGAASATSGSVREWTDQFQFLEGLHSHLDADPHAGPPLAREPVAQEVDVLVVGAGVGGMQTAGPELRRRRGFGSCPCCRLR
jgi:hypothetical protein